ncbi:GDSL-type esterase/lipase family protein [Flavobacterium sp. LB3P122]|uniref:GDSL-type esterase/lipase family protein n=1 Tax=Flavobacterium algoriphilum TaxID=3398738 RepID=UPI003A84B1C7
MKWIVFLLTVFFLNTVHSQEFKADILAFKKQDSILFPPSDAILLIGSSSFTKWNDVSSYFPNHTIINRGFGGSTLLDVIRYENDIVFPYKPKQIVIYCGENDIASSDLITGKIVFERFKILYQDIRKEFPKTAVVYISMKPSPSRWKMNERLIDGNEQIRKFIKRQDNTVFLSVWEKMLDANKKPISTIFLKDNLHMNAQGYSIWQKVIEPALLK